LFFDELALLQTMCGDVTVMNEWGEIWKEAVVTKFKVRSALLWGITQRRLVNLFWRFGTTYRSHLQGSRSTRNHGRLSWFATLNYRQKRRLGIRLLKMGPIRCPETSGKYYHLKLRNVPEERRSHQNRGGKPEIQEIRGTIPSFAWRGWEELWKPWISFTGLVAGIWTRYLQNTKKSLHTCSIVLCVGLHDVIRNFWWYVYREPRVACFLASFCKLIAFNM
jgi:hypothetical protein